MASLRKRIAAAAAAAIITVSAVSVGASAKQAYFVDPEVKSGDWNPFVKDRVIVSVYGCDLSSHATSQFDVANLVVVMKNNTTGEVNRNNYVSTSIWATAQTQNGKCVNSPAQKTFNTPWGDGVQLSAKLDCSNGEVYCWECLTAKPSKGYGTGNISNEVFE